MHEKQKLIERAVVGLVVTAISVDILASELPRVLPYLVVLAVLIAALRLIWSLTNRS